MEEAKDELLIVVPYKVDADVGVALTLWLWLTYQSREACLEVLEKAEIMVVSPGYNYRLDAARPEFANRELVMFDVGSMYVPGRIYDHHFSGGARSATAVVWEELGEKVTDPVNRIVLQSIVDFINIIDDRRVDTDGIEGLSGHLFLEYLAKELNCSSVVLPTERANGPATYPSFLSQQQRDTVGGMEVEDLRALLIKSFVWLDDWYNMESKYQRLMQEQICFPVDERIDVVAVNNTYGLLPHQVRYAYTREYRGRLQKHFIVVMVIDYERRRQLVINNLVPRMLGKFSVNHFKGYLSREFGFRIFDMRLQRNDSIISMPFPASVPADFNSAVVAEYIRDNFRLFDNENLFRKVKQVGKFFSQTEKHAITEKLLSVMDKVLRLSEHPQDLQALDEALSKVLPPDAPPTPLAPVEPLLSGEAWQTVEADLQTLFAPATNVTEGERVASSTEVPVVLEPEPVAVKPETVPEPVKPEKPVEAKKVPEPIKVPHRLFGVVKYSGKKPPPLCFKKSDDDE